MGAFLILVGIASFIAAFIPLEKHWGNFDSILAALIFLTSMVCIGAAGIINQTRRLRLEQEEREKEHRQYAERRDRALGLYKKEEAKQDTSDTEILNKQ